MFELGIIETYKNIAFAIPFEVVGFKEVGVILSYGTQRVRSEGPRDGVFSGVEDHVAGV